MVLTVGALVKLIAGKLDQNRADLNELGNTVKGSLASLPRKHAPPVPHLPVDLAEGGEVSSEDDDDGAQHRRAAEGAEQRASSPALLEAKGMREKAAMLASIREKESLTELLQRHGASHLSVLLERRLGIRSIDGLARLTASEIERCERFSIPFHRQSVLPLLSTVLPLLSTAEL